MSVSFDYVAYTLEHAPPSQHWVRLAHIAMHGDVLHLDTAARNRAASVARALLGEECDARALSELTEDFRSYGVQLQEISRDESAAIQARVAVAAQVVEENNKVGSEDDATKKAERLFRCGDVASVISQLSHATHEGRGVSHVDKVMRLCCTHLIADKRSTGELQSIVDKIPQLLQPKANGGVKEAEVESGSVLTATLYICLAATAAFLNHDFATAAWYLSPTMLRHVGLQSTSHIRNVVRQHISPPEEFALMIALSAIASLPRKEALEVVNSVTIRSLASCAPDIHQLMADFSAFNLASVKSLSESLSSRIVGDVLLYRGWAALQPLLRSAIVLQAIQSFDAASTVFVADMVGMPVEVVETEVANLISTKDANVRIDTVSHTIRKREQLGVSAAALGKILSDGDMIINNTELALLSMSFAKSAP